MNISHVVSAVALIAALGLTAAPAALGQDGSSGPSLDQLLNLPSESGSDSSGSQKGDADGSNGEAEQEGGQAGQDSEQAGSEADSDGQGSEAMRQGNEPQSTGSEGGDPGDMIKLPEEQSPGEFMKAIQDMKLAADRLTTRADAGIQTQRVQERALRRLDQLIEQMRNQKPSSGGSSQQQAQKQDSGSQKNQSKQQQQGKQGQASQSRSAKAAQQAGQQGEVRKGETKDDPLQENLAEWGNLPTRLRDQLLQGSEDRFSPLYRSLTERYYKRLAEESR